MMMTASPAATATLLVVDDDPDLVSVLERMLAGAGYEVRTAFDGETALDAARDLRPDLVIIDVGLPGRTGVEVTRELRELGFRAPMLMLTARSSVSDKVTGLDAGADDYLSKPFESEELLARVQALLRRSGRAASASVMHARDLAFDPIERQVTRGGKRIDLTQKEYALLEYLMRHAGQPVSRHQISEHVWGSEPDPTTNVVDVYINYLRKKIDDDKRDPLIKTLRGVGYQIG